MCVCVHHAVCNYSVNVVGAGRCTDCDYPIRTVRQMGRGCLTKTVASLGVVISECVVLRTWREPRAPGAQGHEVLEEDLNPYVRSLGSIGFHGSLVPQNI